MAVVVYFRSLGNALYPELRPNNNALKEHFRSLGNALYPERAGRDGDEGGILDHWEMRSIRNHDAKVYGKAKILDHWEMRSIRNDMTARTASVRF